MLYTEPHLIYQQIIRILGNLVKANTMADLIATLDKSLKTLIQDHSLSVAMWDKYEEDLTIYTSDDMHRPELEKIYKKILLSVKESSHGGYTASNIFTEDSGYGGNFFFFEKKQIDDGMVGIFFIEFHDKGEYELFSFIVGDLIPQFWSILSERYQKEKAGEESSMLWQIKDAQQHEEDAVSSIKLNQLLENLLTLALRKTGVKCGAILLVNEDTGELEFEPRAVKGKAVSVIPDKLSSEVKSIAVTVLQTNRHYICNDTDTDENYYPMFQGIKSSLAAPIMFQGRCIGVISVESEKKNKFEESDAGKIISLAQTATMFIRRAQLYKLTALRGEGIMILGRSEKWKEVEKRVEKASRTDATVMLRGETGTGKELLAYSIHFNSPRKDNPFVTLNCAAIPSELLESEMFGYVKGAFTGANMNKVGEFERADGGTIFLDEIGDLPIMLQVKLLRTLQSGEIRPVGSQSAPKKINVRVISATSRNLEAMCEKGEFRLDMYYRLHVVPIVLPPLRDYKDDIPFIVNNFIKEANAKYNTRVIGIHKDALNLLMAYDYPGNVRQLRNFIQQAIIMADSEYIMVENLPDELGSAIKSINATGGSDSFVGVDAGLTKQKNYLSYKEEKEKAMSGFTHEYFTGLLEQNRGNIQKTARMSGISRVALYKLLERYNINYGRG